MSWLTDIIDRQIAADKRAYTPANASPDPDANRTFSAWATTPVVANPISNLSQLTEQAAKNQEDLETRYAAQRAQGVAPADAFQAAYAQVDAPFVFNGTSTDIGTLGSPTSTVTPKTTRQTTRTSSKSSTAPVTTSSSNSQNQGTSMDVPQNTSVDTNGFGWLNDLLPLLAAGGLGYLLAK